MASSFGPRPGPVSLTLTNSQIGVSSAGGNFSGILRKLGKAHVPSVGGTNDTSYVVVIRLTLLDAVKRIATVRSATTRLTVRDQICNDLAQSYRIRLDASDSGHFERLAESEIQVNLLHLAFGSKDGQNLSRFLFEIHFDVVQTEHVELDSSEGQDVSGNSFLNQPTLIDTCCQSIQASAYSLKPRHLPPDPREALWSA